MKSKALLTFDFVMFSILARSELLMIMPKVASRCFPDTINMQTLRGFCQNLHYHHCTSQTCHFSLHLSENLGWNRRSPWMKLPRLATFLCFMYTCRYICCRIRLASFSFLCVWPQNIKLFFLAV